MIILKQPRIKNIKKVLKEKCTGRGCQAVVGCPQNSGEISAGVPAYRLRRQSESISAAVNFHTDAASRLLDTEWFKKNHGEKDGATFVLDGPNTAELARTAA